MALQVHWGYPGRRRFACKGWIYTVRYCRIAEAVSSLWCTRLVWGVKDLLRRWHVANQIRGGELTRSITVRQGYISSSTSGRADCDSSNGTSTSTYGAKLATDQWQATSTAHEIPDPVWAEFSKLCETFEPRLAIRYEVGDGGI